MNAVSPSSSSSSSSSSTPSMGNAPEPSVDVSLSQVHRELSSRRRWVHRIMLVVNAVAIAALLSLWTTEPDPLPTRLHVAFSTLLLIQTAWVIASSWVLTRQQCPDSLARIATSRVSVAACGLFTTVGLAICVTRGDLLAAMVLGGIGFVATGFSIVNLRRAHSKHAELLGLLQDRRRSHVPMDKLVLCLVLSSIGNAGVECRGETRIDARSQMVINRHIDACGGRDAMEKIRTQRIQGSLVRQGRGIPIELLRKSPNLSRTTTRFPHPGTLVQGFDGQQAWVVHPVRGTLSLDAKQRQSIADDSWMHRMLSVRDVFQTVQYHSGDNVHHSDDGLHDDKTVLRMKKHDGTLLWWTFDKSTLRLTKIESTIDLGPRGEAKVVVELDDYRFTDDVAQPWMVRTVTPTTTTELVVESVENNLEVNDHVFVLQR